MLLEWLKKPLPSTPAKILYRAENTSRFLQHKIVPQIVSLLPDILNPVISDKNLILAIRVIPAIRPLGSHTLVTPLASIQHPLRLLATSLELGGSGDGLIASESFPHVDEAALAFAVAFLELLALGGESVGEGWAETFGGGVAVDEDAVGILEAEG